MNGRANRFRSEMSGGEASLFLYDSIGENWWGGGVSPQKVVEAIAEAERSGARRLNVFINSPGGNAFDGMAIYSAIRRFKGEKHICIDGLAASAASVIAMAGDVVDMTRVAMLMVHNPSSLVIGESKDLRKEAEVLDAIRDSMIAAYCHKTGKKSSELRELCDGETWMTADQAVDAHFADSVVEEEPDEDEDEADGAATLAASAIVGSFKSAPPDVLRLLSRSRLPIAAARGAPKQEPTMTFEELKSQLTAATAEIAQLKTSNGTLEIAAQAATKRETELLSDLGAKSSGEAQAIMAGLKAKAGKADELAQQLASVEAERVAAKRTALIDEAVKAGRLPPAERARLLGAEAPAWSKDPETLESFIAMLPKALVPVVALQPPDADVVALTPEEREVARQLKIDPKDLVTRKAAQK